MCVRLPLAEALAVDVDLPDRYSLMPTRYSHEVTRICEHHMSTTTAEMPGGLVAAVKSNMVAPGVADTARTGTMWRTTPEK